MTDSWPDVPLPPLPSSFGRVRLGSVTTTLVLLMVGLFVADRMLVRFNVFYVDAIAPGINLPDCPPVAGMFLFSFGLAFKKWELWRCLAYPFAHVSALHLLANVGGLHFFGPMLETYYGSKRYLFFCILCTLGGVGGYLAFYWWGRGIVTPWLPMFSASAMVFGVLVAATQVVPNVSATIYDLIPIRLRVLAAGLLIVVAYVTFTYSRVGVAQGESAYVSAGGAAAHLGGALVGLLLVRFPQWTRLLTLNPFRRQLPF